MQMMRKKQKCIRFSEKSFRNVNCSGLFHPKYLECICKYGFGFSTIAVP